MGSKADPGQCLPSSTESSPGMRMVQLKAAKQPQQPILDEHGCRRIISYTHMLPEDEDLPANFPVSMSDIAIAMISGRHEFFNTSHETVLRYAPRGVLIKVPAACPCSFRAAFRRLKAHHPDAKWYYVGDEDAIVNLQGLATVLSKYDSSKPTLVSGNGNLTICEQCNACPTIMTTHGRQNTHGFFGGCGQVMSTGLLHQLDKQLDGVCTEVFQPTLSGLGDLENTCTLARSWDPSIQFVQLQLERVSFARFWDDLPKFIVAHHLCPGNIKLLSHVNRQMPTASKTLIFLSNSDNDGCGSGAWA
eukprot:CAMPEP_0171058296 /NCGR_PEP_ID=MMETSP0766_2-20121228/2417_1 /TAXON_ID=439317 /ORGANISM="Gambierdiscus australes, Strain CAWD 149" /LENGTH=303 /DNA_ID=CAMNT_0011513557 /DNA_START=40 /DNA_END=951 /DNA_ORIENTATION=-